MKCNLIRESGPADASIITIMTVIKNDPGFAEGFGSYIYPIIKAGRPPRAKAQYVGSAQAREILGIDGKPITDVTLKRWLREGKITGKQIGRKWYFDRAQLEAVAASGAAA